MAWHWSGGLDWIFSSISRAPGKKKTSLPAQSKALVTCADSCATPDAPIQVLRTRTHAVLGRVASSTINSNAYTAIFHSLTLTLFLSLTLLLWDAHVRDATWYTHCTCTLKNQLQATDSSEPGTRTALALSRTNFRRLTPLNLVHALHLHSQERTTGD